MNDLLEAIRAKNENAWSKFYEKFGKPAPLYDPSSKAAKVGKAVVGVAVVLMVVAASPALSAALSAAVPALIGTSVIAKMALGAVLSLGIGLGMKPGARRHAGDDG